MFIPDNLKLNSIIKSLIFLLIVTDENSAQKSESNELSAIYLDVALDMLKKAKDHYPAAEAVKVVHPQDCYEVLNLGNHTSGIYRIWPQNRVMEGRSIGVYCDMETDGGGWTVIQRRGNFQRPVDYFYKDWESYKKGFGNLEEDFWLGNDNIFAISNQKEYSARFDLRDVDGDTKYAVYDFFWIDDEYHKYMLHIKDYKGDAGDCMYPKHDKQNFSTKDQKNDRRNNTESCAVSYKGAWWYNSCYDSNLNGLYLRGKHESFGNGVNWRSWKGLKESLEGTEIKLRPKDLQKTYSLQKTNSFLTPTPEH